MVRKSQSQNTPLAPDTDPRTLNVWSDGACLGNPGAGGYSAVIVDPQTGSVLRSIRGGEPQTTSQRMELRGAIEVLKSLRPGKKVRLRTVSQYVVTGMREWLKPWKRRCWKTVSGTPVANADLWQELERVADLHSVDWIQVKSRSGDAFSESCDIVARAEAEEQKAKA